MVDSKGTIKEVIVGAKPDLDQLVRAQLDRLMSAAGVQKTAGAPVQPPAANPPAATPPAAIPPAAIPPAAPQPAPRTPSTSP